MLSEYDEYGSSDGDCCAGGIIPDPGVVIGGSGDCASGVGETVDIGNVDTTDANVHADGDIVKILVNTDEKIQRGSSTEPSTGLTPDDESPSLGIFMFVYIFYFKIKLFNIIYSRFIFPTDEKKIINFSFVILYSIYFN